MPSWDINTAPNTGNKKVAILVPHGGNSDYRDWRDRFHAMEKPAGSSWLEITGLTLTTARTQLVQEAMKASPEYIFFLDDDVIAPVNTIPLLMSYNLPIACGLYMAKKKKGERSLAAWMHAPAEWNKDGYIPITLQQNGRLIQVDVTGLGCVLIKTDILQKLSMPWFHWEAGGKSEDFFFYEKVFKELGIKPIIDLEVRCDHVGVFKVDVLGEFTTLGG